MVHVLWECPLSLPGGGGVGGGLRNLVHSIEQALFGGAKIGMG